MYLSKIEERKTFPIILKCKYYILGQSSFIHSFLEILSPVLKIYTVKLTTKLYLLNTLLHPV